MLLKHNKLSEVGRNFLTKHNEFLRDLKDNSIASTHMWARVSSLSQPMDQGLLPLVRGNRTYILLILFMFDQDAGSPPQRLQSWRFLHTVFHSRTEFWSFSSIKTIAWVVGTLSPPSHASVTRYGPPNHCGAHQINWSFQKPWVSQGQQTNIVGEGTMGDQVAPLTAVREESTSWLRQSSGMQAKRLYDSCKCWQERKMTPMLPPAWIMVLLHFWVGPSLYGFPKGKSHELKGPLKIAASFQRGAPWDGHGQAGMHLSPSRASPHVPTWLVENIWFTHIPSLCLGGF